jgi:ribosomal protein S18 acetylase RimI-like enzyme
MVTIRPGVTADAHAMSMCELAAFADDPMIMWMFGAGIADDDKYEAGVHAFYHFWGVNALKAGVVDIAESDESGALVAGALWMPPGVTDWDDERQQAFEKVVRATAFDRGERALTGVQALDAHLPPEQHWYLGTISVLPAHQHSGVGGALLRHGLARADGRSSSIYLESTNPRNVALYEHFGFAVREVYELVPGGPQVAGMLRPPQ